MRPKIVYIKLASSHKHCTCYEIFFGSSVIIFIFKKKKKIWISFFFFFLKTWISRRVFYFVGILSRVGYIFLPGCPQVFSLLKVMFRSIFESHKSLIQRGESSYLYYYLRSFPCLGSSI